MRKLDGMAQPTKMAERQPKATIETMKTRMTALTMEAELIDQRDARGEPETFQELKKFMLSYNTVRASLDRCLASLEVLNCTFVPPCPFTVLLLSHHPKGTQAHGWFAVVDYISLLDFSGDSLDFRLIVALHFCATELSCCSLQA